jgi:hypothetical protein
MSFTIKCDKCGKEQTLKSGLEFDKFPCIALYADVSIFGGAYSKSIIIDCDCKNAVEEKTYIG